ncbi:MAG: 8-amino-7-oxononanoate synthase, partial [Planctomycetaceae bacterium]|nr:8-amino-7-oxononanoate synthase [Planctomycetaceae bacterium]
MLPWIAEELAALTDAGLLRRRRELRLLPDGWCEIDGRRVRNFAGNDYLGLASDPRVIAAAEAALREYG